MIIVIQCKIGDRNNYPPLSLVGNRAFLHVQPKTSICGVEVCADPGALNVLWYNNIVKLCVWCE